MSGLSTLSILQGPVERNDPGVGIDAALVRRISVVRMRRVVHENRLLVTPVLVGMPDAGRDPHDTRRLRGEPDLVHAAPRRRILPPVEQRDPDVRPGNEIAVGLHLVHAPALDAPGADREAIAVTDG